MKAASHKTAHADTATVAGGKISWKNAVTSSRTISREGAAIKVRVHQLSDAGRHALTVHAGQGHKRSK